MSALLTSLWYANNRQALRALLVQNRESHRMCIDACDASIQNLASRLHAVLGESEEMAIRKFVSEPLMVLKNTALLDLPLELGAGAMDTVMRTMFWQLSQVFLQIEGIFYAGPNNDYVEYERLAHHTGQGLERRGLQRHNLTEGAYSMEFDVGRTVNESYLLASCPKYCPPLEELKPAHRNVYLVSNSSGVPIRLLDRFPEDTMGQDWYGPVARARGKAVWDGPRNWRGNVRLRVAKALMQNDKVKFVVGADFTLSYLSQFLQSMDLGAKGLVFIFDSDGRIISSWPSVGELPEGLDLHKQEMPHWTTLNHTLLRAVMGDLVRHHNGLECTDCQEGVRHLDFGSGYLYSSKFILSNNDDFHLKWHVVNVQPLSFYEGSFRKALSKEQKQVTKAQNDLAMKLQQSLLIMLFISGAFLLSEAAIIFAVAEAITQPLKLLQNDMRSVAKLEFGVMEGVDSLARQESIGSAESNEVCELEEVKVVNCPCFFNTDPVVAEKPPRRKRSSWIQEVADIRDSFTHMATGLQSFSRYMDPSLVRMLVQSKRRACLGVAQAEVTIFFSDIANFTSLAENLDQAVFMNMLGAYLDEMASIIMAQSGIVGEFVGDAIMAWWNAPEHLGDEHTVLALTAALKQQACLKRLREQWAKAGLPQVRARMGLAKGQVLAGNIGSRERMKYGLVGDTVNLASRLESLCKRYRVEVLIDDVASKAPGVSDKFLLRPLGLVTVKGRTSVTELYELVGMWDEASESPVAGDLEAFCTDFKFIQDLYQQGAFGEALQMIHAYQQRWPDDYPAQMMRQRCEELAAHNPGPDWSPIEWLSEK